MSEKYYQEYGPIKRRRSKRAPLDPGRLPPDQPPDDDDAPRPPHRTPLPAPRRARSFSVLTTLVLLGVLLGAFFLIQPSFRPITAAERAPEGVTLQGQSVGGMDRAQLQALLAQRYAAFLQQPIILEFEQQRWTPTLADLGVSFDLNRIADEILTAGQHTGLLERLERLTTLQLHGLDVAPRLSIDLPTLQAYLTSLAAGIDAPPRDAALSISLGQVLSSPSVTGRQLLVDQSVTDIVLALQTLEPQTVVLRTRSLEPRLPDAAMAQAVNDAQLILSRPLTITQDGRAWTWEVERIAGMLVLTSTDGLARVEVDRGLLKLAVERLAQSVDSGSAEPRVAFRDGRLQIIEPGATGLRVQQDAAVEALAAALRAPAHTLELPVERLDPQVTEATLPALGIVELISEGKSSFAGSAEYRITNIKAGARRIDGVLIPPGAEFSFNTQLGNVDEANGFVQGYAVVGGRTQLEWGGGVCQNSTTVFRAAFWAGLPITERHAHPFYIRWYDEYSFPQEAAPGMDATIYTGQLDLKFLNDTGHWMLMEAEVDENAQVLTVRLYGTRPDRSVSIIGPQFLSRTPPPSQPVYVNDPNLPAGVVKQTDTARAGMEIMIYRVITVGGVEQPPEEFYTGFRPWPNIFSRGTGP